MKDIVIERRGSRKVHVEFSEDVHLKLRMAAALENMSMLGYCAMVVGQDVADIPIPERGGLKIKQAATESAEEERRLMS